MRIALFRGYAQIDPGSILTIDGLGRVAVDLQAQISPLHIRKAEVVVNRDHIVSGLLCWIQGAISDG
jgi:hypothetical protein